jgi:glycosyltransferase involved in cell wall biosynthesis
VSVVICTRNRPDKIGQAVSSVLANDYPSFELTVIDQSTSRETADVVEPIAASDKRLRYHHVDETGLSRAYNSGIAKSSGEILAFTDDDCIVAADWISTIVAAFAAEPDGDLLYGQVLPIAGTETDEGWSPMLEIDAPRRLSRKDGFHIFGMGANFAARSRLFDAVGPFDVVLGGGAPLKSSQDFDLAYRAFHADCVTLLRPEVTLTHDGRRAAEDWPTLLVAYGTGDGAFYTKHVRCRDPYALWLTVRKVVRETSRLVAKTILRRAGTEGPYLRGFIRGVRDSFEFEVDRRTRLYVEK